MEAGKEPLQLELLECVTLLHNVRELFEPQIATKDLELVLSVPQEPTTLWTDATKLQQILINVVGNAIKFTDAGRSIELKPTPSVRTSSSRHGTCDFPALERISSLHPTRSSLTR